VEEAPASEVGGEGGRRAPLRRRRRKPLRGRRRRSESQPVQHGPLGHRHSHCVRCRLAAAQLPPVELGAQVLALGLASGPRTAVLGVLLMERLQQLFLWYTAGRRGLRGGISLASAESRPSPHLGAPSRRSQPVARRAAVPHPFSSRSQRSRSLAVLSAGPDIAEAATGTPTAEATHEGAGAERSRWTAVPR